MLMSVRLLDYLWGGRGSTMSCMAHFYNARTAHVEFYRLGRLFSLGVGEGIRSVYRCIGGHTPHKRACNMTHNRTPN